MEPFARFAPQLNRYAFFRNAVEYLVIVVVWLICQAMIQRSILDPLWMKLLVVVLAWTKTAFFGLENLQQLWQASRDNMAYHRFMLLMLVNMSQIMLSFALDYHCLHCIDPASFGSINPAETMPEMVFDFFYFSVLNFTFFGYGDITPQTVSAKLLTMTEIVLAFVTVLFMLSDFISLKESIRPVLVETSGEKARVR
jgi:hypothetical protein